MLQRQKEGERYTPGSWLDANEPEIKDSSRPSVTVKFFAPSDVVKGAEAVLRAIVEISLKPGIELRRLANEALSESLDPDPLLSFSSICRADLDNIRRTAV